MGGPYLSSHPIIGEPAHSQHDILTITGCGMDDAEVRKHLEWNIEMIQRWSETPKRGRGRRH